MLGEGCHFVDSLAFLAGSRVASRLRGRLRRAARPLQARDNVGVTLAFAERLGRDDPLRGGRLGRACSKERVEAFSGTGRPILDDYVALELLGPHATGSRVRAKGQDKGHAAEIAAFVDGVTSGIAPVPLEEVANVSLATLAIVESLRTGRPVRLGAPLRLAPMCGICGFVGRADEPLVRGHDRSRSRIAGPTARASGASRARRAAARPRSATAA